ncbi:MAG: AMP-binding protein [Treponema sp.]|jgi:long-chain acyl-CoA synthetase|nr:AMP-binding protein [Treponema sp.]
MKAETLPLMFKTIVKEGPELIAQYARDSAGWFAPRTYKELYDEIRWVAAGLLELGVKRGDLIGLISDNRREWLGADFGILSIGAADVPRGGDTLVQELSYILKFTDCAITFAENQKQADKILSCKDKLPKLKIIITFEKTSNQTTAAKMGVKVFSYDELITMGKTRRPDEIDTEIDKGSGDDLATIIFTSGTTGEPKGVMLTHRNFLCQLPPFRNVFDMRPGEIWLSVLPVWHSFERAVEYMILYHKNTIAYSKPIASILMADFLYIKPHWIATVPRVWEAIMDGIRRSVKQMGGFQKFFFNYFISFVLMYTYFRDLCFGLVPNYHGRIRALDAVMGFFPWLFLLPARGLAWLFVFRRIRKRLGGQLRAGLTGGGTIPPRVDRFFNAVGLKLQEAYGLTEAAPIVSARQYRKSRQGTIGQLLVPDTEFKIVGDGGKILPPGHNGILHVRGEQVMRGYYKKPDLTAEVLSEDGWLNTGDIVMSTYDRELRITGRAKDTIVLRGGENVEPVPIENKLKESPRIHQCMVVGQDQKYLAALIVPRQDAIMSFAEENNIPIVDWELLLQQPEINEIIANDITNLISSREGFRTFERIHKFQLLSKPFEPGIDLSPKMEPMRHKINVRFFREIQALFK